MSNNQYSKEAARKLGFRSGFEVAFADELKELGVKFEYESEACTFRYHKPVVNGGIIVASTGVSVPPDKGNRIVQFCTYTCDFMLPKPDGGMLFIETKGRFMPKDRAKHRLLKKQHPDLDIRILFSNNGKVTSKSRYMDWAEKFDIKCGLIVKPTKNRFGKYIPREWLRECGIAFQQQT
jgi:hypothetical protein